MKDFFGYNRQVKEKELLSADFATLDIGNGKMGLVQNVQAAYQHRVEPRFEAGSSTLYWVNGQPSGNMTVGRLVGRSGLFAGVSRGNAACGDLKKLTISLDGDGQCAIRASGGLKFDGAMLQGVSISYGAGALDIQDSLSFVVATMNVTN